MILEKCNCKKDCPYVLWLTERDLQALVALSGCVNGHTAGPRGEATKLWDLYKSELCEDPVVPFRTLIKQKGTITMVDDWPDNEVAKAAKAVIALLKDMKCQDRREVRSRVEKHFG